MTVKVTKRNGDSQALDIDKIKKVIEWARLGVEGYNKELDINPLKLEASLNGAIKNGVSTEIIQASLVEKAKSFTTVQEADWRYLAGRLLVMDYWKRVSKVRGCVYHIPEDFPNYLIKMVEKNLYEFPIGKYSYSELVEAYSWIVWQRDLDYDYAGANSLIGRYVVQGELFQEMILMCSLLLAQNEPNKMKFAKGVYEAVSTRKISLATPLLKNLRRPKGNCSSCFTLEHEDSLTEGEGSITETWKSISKISQEGGGVGTLLSKIRAKGSWVRGIAKASRGIIPWIKVIDSIAVAVDQTATRPAAVTTALDIWHLDIEDFLCLQTEAGDERGKAHNIYPQVVVPDEFIRRVNNNQSWTLVDPYEVKQVLGIDLVDLWGEKFEEAYATVEASNKITLKKTIEAKELFKNILKAWVETGMPYIAFKDTINKTNPNKDSGLIKLINLCVAPETKILTREGYKEIQSLDGQCVDLWNGEEWSNSPVFKTGESQEMLEIEFSNGSTLRTTLYHKFPGLKKSTRKNEHEVIRAADLKVGDKLIKFDLPVILGEEEFLYPYTSGLFSGDGSYKPDGKPELVLYGRKKELLDLVETRSKMRGNASYSVELEEPSVYYDKTVDRIRIGLPIDIPAKFTVPKATHTIQSRLLWFAGLLDSDGCVVKNNLSEGFQISSNKKEFLLDVMLMLQTMGVDSKVCDLYPEGMRLMPNGQGGKSKYFCKRTYRLLVGQVGINKLSALGLKTNRLTWTVSKSSANQSRHIRVVSIKKAKASDTYCFTEPLRNMGMLEGVPSMNCVESFSNTDEQHHHCCNLVSINGANLESDETEHLTRMSVRILDNAIDITIPPTKQAAAHNQKYRTLGIGFMGLHDWLAKQNLSYQKTEETLGPVSNLFEDIAYYSIDESANLAQERGSFGAFESSEWAKGNMIGHNLGWFTSNAYNVMRWEELSNKVKLGMRNSQLTAVAPNTGSSLIQGCTASVIPVYGKFYVDDNLKSKPPICPPFIKDKFWFYVENKNIRQEVVVDTCSTIQKWVCAGISMELFFDLNKEYVNASYLRDIFLRAWESQCKAIYYIRWIKKNSENVKVGGECTSCAN